MINDSLLVEALKYGRDLADECARVNWKKLEEVEEKVTKEVVEKLAKKLADLKVERRSQSYDYDTLRARGAEGLRAIMSECGQEPDLSNTMVEYMERSFQSRLEEARVGRRKVELLLRKTQLGGSAYDGPCTTSNT